VTLQLVRDTDASIPRATRPRVLVGLMSGTSLDGISAAVVRFARGRRGSHHRLNCSRMSIAPTTTTTRSETAWRAPRAKGRRRANTRRVDFDLGELAGRAPPSRAIAESGVPRERDGRRSPRTGRRSGTLAADTATWQIGESSVIAERTGARRHL
jgi:anhydro-N-acetylmuramic acid kinase